MSSLLSRDYVHCNHVQEWLRFQGLIAIPAEAQHGGKEYKYTIFASILREGRLVAAAPLEGSIGPDDVFR